MMEIILLSHPVLLFEVLGIIVLVAIILGAAYLIWKLVKKRKGLGR